MCAVNTLRPMSPALCARRWFVLMGLLFAFPMLVSAQTNGLQPGEFSISGGQGDQVVPAAAFSASGGFVVWHDNITDPFGLGVSARRLDAGFNPVGDVIHVNQFIGGDQQRPKVAMLQDGGAAVVWQSGRSGAQNIFVRFLTSSGGFAGNEVLVNNAALSAKNRYETNLTFIRNNKARTRRQVINEKIQSRQEFNANPSVAVLNDGSTVVAYASSRVYTTNTFGMSETLRWDDKRQMIFTNRTRVAVNIKTASMQDVYVQRLSSAGEKLGGEFRANQFAQFNQRDAAIAALDNGNFVIAWASEQQRTNSPVDIYARVFDALGNPLGDEFCVSPSGGPSGAPTVAGTPGGGFTIAWAQRGAVRANGMDVFARTYSGSGAATSDAFPVNTFTYGDQFVPSIVSLGSQQLIVWSSMGQDGSWEGVYARAFNGASAVGDEFRVNLWTPWSQMHPQIASDHAGRALIVWAGYVPQGSGFDLFGRTYLAP